MLASSKANLNRLADVLEKYSDDLATMIGITLLIVGFQDQRECTERPITDYS